MIKLVGVYKSYGAINVLEDVTLEVNDGQGLCVIGRNGSGKTTLLKIMGTLAYPDKGSVIINDVDVTRVKEYKKLLEIRREIGFSFQQPLLLPYVNVLDNVLISSSLGRDDVIKLLEYLGLGDRLKHRPNQLSEGEKKRVDLSRAYAKKPKILIADEPFSYLDPTYIEKVSNLFKEFIEGGGILIISSTEESKLPYASKIFRLR